MTVEKIQDFRLSFIWVENILQLIKNEIPPGAKLFFLGNQNGYVSAFEQTQIKENKGIGPEGLQQPWPPGSIDHHFWSHYLEMKIPGRITKKTVMQKLVPFYHEDKDLTIVPPSWLPGRIVLQSYIHPYSIALILTAEIKKELNVTLDEAVAITNKVRRTEKFQIKQSGYPTLQPMSLDELASHALKGLRDYMLGPNAPAHEWSNRPPFSVVTVVRGSGVDRWDEPSKKIINYLDALTRWPSYDWDDPPPGRIPEINAEDNAKVNEGYPGDTLHIAPHGRAVWYPKHFLVKTGRVNKLSCYHKNLNMLSMQINSLGRLVDNAAKEINAGNSPTPASFYETCVKRAAINLGLLYLGGGKEKNTYRSWSAKRQIEQNNYLDGINTIRDRLCNLLPIS